MFNLHVISNILVLEPWISYGLYCTGHTVLDGSIVGPLLFTAYISPICNIASRSGISLQQYIDDTQLYISTSCHNLTPNLEPLESCLRFLHSWFCHNGLALNSDKSETFIFGTSTRLRNFPPVTSVNIAGTPVTPYHKIVTRVSHS